MTASRPTDGRLIGYLDPESVEEYFDLGVPAAFVLSEDPRAQLEIDPGQQQMRLVCPVIGAEPDVAAYERISFERFHAAGDGERYRLSVDALDMHYEAYVLLQSIVDQLREGASFRLAVSTSLEGLKDLLASRKKLTDDEVVGLVGELIVLNHVIQGAGEDHAIEAWLGPLAEERDFGFDHFDAEIKTTRSESRSHWIGNESQLEPGVNRPLYLVSLQITRAGHARDAFTLPSLIDDTRRRLSARLDQFDKALDNLGWRDADTDLYGVAYLERSMPRAYVIDQDFPAITASRLEAAIPHRPLISSVSYRVDVSGLPHSAAPAPLESFCEEPT